MAKNDSIKQRKEELADIRDLMNTNHGRRFMYRLMIRAGIYSTSYNPEMPDSNMAFKEGQRNIGLWTMAELEEAAPESFALMIKENRHDNVD